MSGGGLGIVLLLPLAPVAGAGLVIAAGAVAVGAAASAVAGAGVVVVRETGKAAIACGRELKTMAGENLAMQHSLHQASQQYEAQLFQREQELTHMRREQIRVQMEQRQQAMRDHQQTIASLQARLNQPVVETSIDWDAVQSLRDELLALAPPKEPVRRELLSGWPRKVRQAQELTSSLAAGLQSYTDGPYRGLFRTTALEQTLAETNHLLAELEAQAGAVLLGQATPDSERYEQVCVNLAVLDRRLEEMRQERPQRQQQRQDALAALEQARVALSNASETIETGAQLAGLQVAEATLDDAFRAFEDSEYTRACSTAEAVQSHLETLDQTVSRQRQHNLRLMLQRLRRHVEPLATLDPLKPAVDAWLARCESCEQLSEQDVAAAWQHIDGDEGLSAQSEQLQQHALDLLMQHNTATLTALSHEALHAMGYEVETNQHQEGSVTLTGRQEARRIYIALSEQGTMSLNLEGYGDSSCQTAMQQFLDHLRAHGVEGAWQQRFTLTDATQQMVGMLQKAGLDVKTERTDEGMTILARGQVTASATIDYDGRAHLSEELQHIWQEKVRAHEPAAAPTTADEVVHTDMDQEWIRLQEQHARHLEAAMVREQRG